MSPLAILFPHVEGGLDRLAIEAVDETRFTHAGRADEGAGAAGVELTAQLVNSAPCEGADNHDRGGARDGAAFRHTRILFTREVRLVQHDHTTGATLVNHDEKAFQPAQVERGVQRLDHECDIDIGGENLGRRFAAGHLACQRGPPWKDTLDNGP
jgi:hypothetical protein